MNLKRHVARNFDSDIVADILFTYFNPLKLVSKIEMKTSSRKINSVLKTQIKKTFAQVIADIKDPNESNTLLTDLLTESEYEGLAKRLAVAYWLKKGRSYNNIKNNLKVSTATIASVQTMMKKPGFQLALKKIEAEEWANQWSQKIKKFVK